MNVLVEHTVCWSIFKTRVNDGNDDTMIGMSVTNCFVHEEKRIVIMFLVLTFLWLAGLSLVFGAVSLVLLLLSFTQCQNQPPWYHAFLSFFIFPAIVVYLKTCLSAPSPMMSQCCCFSLLSLSSEPHCCPSCCNW